MPANSKRNTLAIKSKTKDIQTKKLSTIKDKKINSKSIAKVIKIDKLDNCESNTSAIDHKTKDIQTKKLSIIKDKKINSKSIAKAIKIDKLDNCESNTSAIDHKTKEPCKSIAKVLPKNNIVDLQITPQLKQNIINVAQAAPGLIEMLDWYHKKHKNVIEIPEIKINNKALGEAIITKTFKISEKAIKNFIEFAEKHPHFKHQDLLGMALIEFVEKYHNF